MTNTADWAVEYAIAEIAARFPPEAGHPKKRLLFELAGPVAAGRGATIRATRTAARPGGGDGAVGPEPAVDVVTKPYGSAAAGGPAAEWFVNFSGPSLFSSFALAPFAQDEIQVAEHPVLASLRAALAAERRTLSLREGADPAVITVAGAPRQIGIELGPLPGTDAPGGIYGRRLVTASDAAVRAAVSRVDPPTLTNIVAMEAPQGGTGVYSAAQVERIVRTAVTGFAAARRESGGGPITVHTGFWGCGAYGGDRVLMVGSQIVAARIAGVARVVLHAVDGDPGGDAKAGAALAERACAPSGGWLGRALGRPQTPATMAAAVAALTAARREWHSSDGN